MAPARAHPGRPRRSLVSNSCGGWAGRPATAPPGLLVRRVLRGLSAQAAELGLQLAEALLGGAAGLGLLALALFRRPAGLGFLTAGLGLLVSAFLRRALPLLR